MTSLRIGTRGSPLALWQAKHVAAAIAKNGGPPTKLITIRTSGDRLSNASLSKIGGKRLFVKEIEEALVEDRIDLAVHSAKDLPSERLPGLSICAALPREDPRDAIVASQSNQLDVSQVTAISILGSSKSPLRIGTGSIRRTAQLKHAFPGINISSVRGNVGTRLRKLDDGNFDLLVLATAGLLRLNLANRITARIPSELCVPAPGQGIVVGEYRNNDAETDELLASIADPETTAALAAERALVTALGADCQVPLGAIATPSGDQLIVRGVVASPDGKTLINQEAHGSFADASNVGREVASLLLKHGAESILSAARSMAE
ncbi:MAG TPA: hydroxymethylbilane synthase [Acidobacteria bacterium]|nr:hydroxymethylbilane synthase [Acidobacteriota bacterium]